MLLILKWGGVLTPSGEMCAEELGKAFRCMYPGGEGEYSSLPGSGFLRLHSTYRHDLKVIINNDNRCTGVCTGVYWCVYPLHDSGKESANTAKHSETKSAN